MSTDFIVELHDRETGKFINTSSSHNLGQMPSIGDVLILPEVKRDLGLGDPAKHFAYEVSARYLLADKSASPSLVKLFVTCRSLTTVEATLLPSRPQL